MYKVPFLDVGDTYRELRGEIDAAVTRVLQSGRYIQGDEVENFESNFASYVEAKYCVGVANGLDAIYLALRALGIGIGDEVIVPAVAWSTTYYPLYQYGLKLKFVDIDIEKGDPTVSDVHVDTIMSPSKKKPKKVETV